MTSSDLLSKILEHLKTEQVIGEYVPLRQTGRTLKGLCPFHAEKTPSFHVNSERGLWHCFGCGAGGNLIQFLMRIENTSFQEAKATLAKKAGITLDPAFEAQNQKQNRLRRILDLAASFYHQTLLKSHAGEAGLAYLQNRTVEAKIIEKFQLGMAPPSGRALLNHLSHYDFTLDEIIETGLCRKNDTSKDYFCQRIMFPIWNSSGHLIGFGGRTLGEDEPKYLNSPESALFKKGENLYGLHFAKQGIGKEKCALLAEGYMDVLMLHQHGFEQSIASLGTSLTNQQAKLLSRYTSKALIGYDGDTAGIEAMRRAMVVLQNANMDLALISLPQGEDPDSFLKKEGADALNKVLKNALSPVDFIFSEASKKYDFKTPEGKKKIVDEVLPILDTLHDPLLRDEYLKRVAQGLDISESVLRKRIRTKKESSEFQTSSLSSREHEILRWLLHEPDLAETIWSVLRPEDFQETETKQSAEMLHQLWREGKKTIGEMENIPDSTLLLLSRLSTETPVGSNDVVYSLIEAQKNQNQRKNLSALKTEISRRLKEGKLNSTDEAYTTYLTLLKKTKLKEENL